MTNSNETDPDPLSPQQRRFLELYEIFGNASTCAKMICESRSVVVEWSQESPLFARELDRADHVFHDKISKIVLSEICRLAQRGNREAAQVICDQYGKVALNEVMRGKILKWGGEES